MRLRPRREFIEFDYFYLRNCIVVGFNERESMERGNERIKRFKNPLSRHDAEKLICRSFERTFINNKEQLLRNGIKILQFRRLRSLIRMLLRKSDRLNCFFLFQAIFRYRRNVSTVYVALRRDFFAVTENYIGCEGI